jgi:hypothetical protein
MREWYFCWNVLNKFLMWKDRTNIETFIKGKIKENYLKRLKWKSGIFVEMSLISYWREKIEII